MINSLDRSLLAIGLINGLTINRLPGYQLRSMLRLMINEVPLILTENLVERVLYYSMYYIHIMYYVLYPQPMYYHSAKAG